MAHANGGESTRKVNLNLENAVVRSSQLEQHVFNFVWKVHDIPHDLNCSLYFESPIFTDPETGNEWRLKHIPNPCYRRLCMSMQLVGCGSGEIIQTALELNFLDSEMKKSLYYTNHSSKAHQPRGENEDFFETVDLYSIGTSDSQYLSSDGALIIHIAMKTTHMHHNHKDISGLSQRKCKNRQVEILAQQLQNLWPNDKFSDIALVTDRGTRFPASKLILAANSPVFHAMFNSEMKEATENQVKIPGFSDDVLKGFLDFVYIGTGSGSDQTHSTCLLKENAAELLKFAEAYDVKHLKEECERILIRNLTIENAADMLYLATFFNSPALKEKVVEFFKRYRKEVQNTPAFKQMKIQNPQVLLEFYSELN